MINNPFNSKRDPSLIVDRLLGESYKIVKAVYCQLPELVKIIESENLQFIVDHFETIERILALEDQIIDIGDNLDEILKAQSYANSAKADAELAQKWAIKLDEPVNGIDFSSKHYALESKTLAEQVKEDADEVRSINQAITPVARSVTIVANNINSVNTTAGNIKDVNVVAADLEAEFYDDTDIDYGNVDDPDAPDGEITGGNIVLVAQNIDDIVKVAKELDYLRIIGEYLGHLPADILNIEKLLDETKKAANEATKAKDEAIIASKTAKQAVTAVTNEGIKQVGTVVREGNKQAERIETLGEKVLDLIKQESLDHVLEAEQAAVKNIKHQEVIAIEAVQNEAKKQKEEVIAAVNEAGQVALDAAEDALESATKAETALNETTAVINNFYEIASGLLNLTRELKIVADNIQHIVTNSTNIETIKIVGSDLEGSISAGNTIDYGNLDEDDSGSPIITGGNIFICAQNIEAIKKVAANINNLPGGGGNPSDPSNYYTKAETEAKIREILSKLDLGSLV